MGRRHQFFVIARVGEWHRCLGAVHSDWEHGIFAIQTCQRLVKVFSSHANRVPLLLELKQAVEFFRSQRPGIFDSSNVHNGRTAAFPFITTSLITETSLYEDGTLPDTVNYSLPHWTQYEHCRNNDGVTVIDITDLEDVRYCFVVWRIPNWATTPVPLDTPLSVHQYLSLYDSDGDIRGHLGDQLANNFDQIHLVDARALADVWPYRHRNLAASNLASNLLAPVVSEKPKGVIPLRDQCLATFLDHVLSFDEPNILSLLEVPLLLPNFGVSLRAQMVKFKDRLPTSLATPDLLKAAYSGDTILDWSDFPGLSSSTIIAALDGPELEAAHELRLCSVDWMKSSTTDLATAICNHPRIHDLYIVDPPNRMDDKASREMYMRLASNPNCPRGRLFLTGAFSAAIGPGEPDPVPFTVRPHPTFPIQHLLVYDDRPISVDLTGHHQSIYLGDTSITIPRFVNAFTSLLRLIDEYWRYAEPLDTAVALLASSHYVADGTSDVGIGPLPAEALIAAQTRGYQMPLRDLAPGCWTVILSVTHIDQAGEEDPETCFDASFVRMRNDYLDLDIGITCQQTDDLEVLSLEDFIRLEGNGVTFSQMTSEVGVGVMGREESISLLGEFLKICPKKP